MAMRPLCSELLPRRPQYADCGTKTASTAGTQNGIGSVVTNFMWGSAPGLPAAQGSHNTFVFEGDLVGTQNYVEDFHQGQDTIEFTHMTGVHNFSDLSISTNGAGDTIVGTLHDTVILVGFADTLTQHDFLIV